MTVSNLRKPVHLIAVIDEGSGYEAIYVDGELRAQALTIYAIDIVKAADGAAAIMSHVVVSMPDNIRFDGKRFPQRFDQCAVWETDDSKRRGE